MSIYSKPTILATALIALFFTEATAGTQGTDSPTSWPISTAIRTEAGQQIPSGALGVALIDAPREATLMQLRGMVGTGEVILRSSDSRDCLTLPIRFVAGDLGGNSISSRPTKRIRLFIQSTRVAQALADGEDIVSDMYRISNVADDPDADIIIQSGLSESYGFVLNPGRSILADILGENPSRTRCLEL